ncbi:hypothetical protein SSP24_03240 [Streptomyces spinoverrucosus]|uniref:Lipopolysaccharide assembly protein A domain-containing protein n=1 Tax=Streptomyces spinoverrucosus TaxID=284043 RepID=A0A4Y3VAE8_9ACTN|nr:hypothetical protein [Streptomyces spinoverrucosus]GEC02669.1 hypothetical protein SSP24_03240 [Streptomyces spinoverrucosus]GHB41369.1 hypothetical protein GCM10010397_09360 [Streptomyces spinoverrucosus]
MIALGLLLALATGGFAAIAVAENFRGGSEYAVEVFGNQIATLSPPGLFLSGAALALIFCLGLAMIAAGLKHRRRVRKALASAPVTGEPGAERPLPPQPVHRRRRHIFGH